MNAIDCIRSLFRLIEKKKEKKKRSPFKFFLESMEPCF